MKRMPQTWFDKRTLYAYLLLRPEKDAADIRLITFLDLKRYRRQLS